MPTDRPRTKSRPVTRRRTTRRPQPDEGPLPRKITGYLPDVRPTPILLWGDISDCAASVVETIAGSDREERFELLINCRGGEVSEALSIAHVIERTGVRVSGVVTGLCWSAATVVFAACADMQVYPTASFLFHPASWSVDLSTRGGAARTLRHFEKQDDAVISFLSRRLCVDPEQLRAMCQCDTYLDAAEFIRLVPAARLVEAHAART